MSNYLEEFVFKKPPKKITYLDDEPLKLTEEFVFFHNKSKIRKGLAQLQYLIKSYTKNPLLALGIRDAYLKKELTDKYLIVLLTTSEVVKETNKIIGEFTDIEFNQGCFYLLTNSNYMLLLTRDMDGLNTGINTMGEILNQVLKDYFSKKFFEDYIKICPFRLLDCSSSNANSSINKTN